MISTISSGVILFNSENNGYTKIHPDINAMGLVKYGDKYLVAHREGIVYVLANDFSIEKELVNNIVNKDDNLNFHDILVIDDKLYIVESSTNTIKIHNVDTGEYIDSIKLFNDDAPRYHLNCMKYKDGKFYLSMHFFDSDELAVESYINNVPVVQDANKVLNANVRMKYPTGAVIKFDPTTHAVEQLITNGLGQPHSICFVGDELHFADSLRNRIVNGKRDSVMDTGEYYPRGMSSNGEQIFIGLSSLRHGVSEKATATLRISDINFNTIKDVVLKGTGVTEIYDVIIMG